MSSHVLYANSTGEIREQLLAEDGSQITTGTVTCTFVHGSTTIFSGRAMSYSSTRRVNDVVALGCWFCTVQPTEVTSTQGIYYATITGIDGSGNQLVTVVEISVETFTG